MQLTLLHLGFPLCASLASEWGLQGHVSCIPIPCTRERLPKPPQTSLEPSVLLQ